MFFRHPWQPGGPPSGPWQPWPGQAPHPENGQQAMADGFPGQQLVPFYPGHLGHPLAPVYYMQPGPLQQARLGQAWPPPLVPYGFHGLPRPPRLQQHEPANAAEARSFQSLAGSSEPTEQVMPTWLGREAGAAPQAPAQARGSGEAPSPSEDGWRPASGGRRKGRRGGRGMRVGSPPSAEAVAGAPAAGASGSAAGPQEPPPEVEASQEQPPEAALEQLHLQPPQEQPAPAQQQQQEQQQQQQEQQPQLQILELFLEPRPGHQEQQQQQRQPAEQAAQPQASSSSGASRGCGRGGRGAGRGPLRQGSPSRNPCLHFLKTGECSYGDRCRFAHPEALRPRFTQGGLPIHPGEPDCSFHRQYKWCGFGKGCKFNHRDSYDEPDEPDEPDGPPAPPGPRDGPAGGGSANQA